MNFSVSLSAGLGIQPPLRLISLQQQPPSLDPNPNPNPPKPDEIKGSPLSSPCPNQRLPGNPDPSDEDLLIQLEKMSHLDVLVIVLEKMIYLDVLVKVEQSLEEAAKESGCRAQVLIAMAKALWEENSFAMAEKCLGNASEILNNGKLCKAIKLAEAYSNIGLLYKRLHKKNLQIESFNRMMDIYNQPKELSKKKVRAIKLAGRIGEARDRFPQLYYDPNPAKIEEAPSDPDAILLEKEKCFLKKEQYFMAFVILDKCLPVSETRAHVIIAMAIAFFENAMFANSKRCLQTASAILGIGIVKETINIAKAYGKIGMLYESMEEYKLAKLSFERMVAIYNKHPLEEKVKVAEEVIARAISLFQQKRFVDSKRCLKIATEILVNGKLENAFTVAGAYEKMGMLYERMGEYELAMSLFDRILTMVHNLRCSSES